jgi:hypothetical protein
MNIQSEAGSMNKHEEILSKYHTFKEVGIECVTKSDALKAMRELEESLAARTEGDGWIKVEDWKPDENSKVWIAFADNSVEEGYYKTWNNELCFTDLKGWKYVEEITHYKLYSIPKPPL